MDIDVNAICDALEMVNEASGAFLISIRARFYGLMNISKEMNTRKILKK